MLRNRLLNCSSTGTTTAAGFWGIFTSTGATTVNIDSNQVIGYTYAGGVTTVPTGGVIYNSTSTSAITNFNVRGNLIRDLSCNGTGTFGAIQSGAQILGTFFVAGNQIRNFTRNSASGIAAMIYHSSGVTANFTSFQNVIDSVRITATTNTTALYGIFDNSALLS